MSQATRETVTSRETQEGMTEQELKAAQQAGQAALENIKDEDLDKFLKDIDDILEENAELFVESFVQRGGQ